MTSNLQALFRSKDLLYMLTWRDVHVRYKQSIMGLFWAILMPGLVIGSGVLLRYAAAKWSGTQVSAADIQQLMVRAVPWSFFIASIRFATNSLVSNSSLVTKIAFPKEVFPISASFSNLFDFLVASVIVLVLLFFTGWQPTWQALWALPMLVLLIGFTVAGALILSSANLFFRDVKYLVEVFLTYAIFFTPVLYSASMLGDLKRLILLNPIAPLLEGFANAVVLGETPDVGWTAYAGVTTIVLLVAGYGLFKRLEAKFAEYM